MSKYFRKLVLKKFAKIYDISTGFCSVKYWTSKIERNIFELIQAIHNETFDTSFDFEENYDKLIKRFRHLSLFSVCLHFLRCRRSCEKNMAITKVRENCFYDYNKFENLIVTSDTEYLHITSSERLDLDVFVKGNWHFGILYFDLINEKCCYLEYFSYARDLFALFLAILVRMYLNYTIDYSSELILQVSLSDEEKIIRKIFWFALDLLHKFFDTNYLFFLSSLMCLMRLIQVIVILILKINQNLVHMAHLYIL